MRILPRQWLLQRKNRIKSGKTRLDTHIAIPFLYWRMVPLTLDEGGFACAIAEIEMAASAGGPNLCTGGTAFGEGAINPSYTYAEAFDGQHETSDPYWVTLDSMFPAAHAGYQFASPVAIREVRIRIGNQAAEDAPSEFLIQCSNNGTDWTEALHVTGSTDWIINSMRSFEVPAL